MSTLYLDRKNLTVTHQSGRLRLSAPDEPPRDVPIALLERVVIHARVSLDTTV
ncbi:MAG: CRISPR-associated endonuclease Cas1, partial [Gammaproteobacteria bacterium]|nr:CRISPR-associated endonuclease Cas1 [Gammaproteobacteria bacterium]